MLPSYQITTIGQANLIYSPLGKASEKQMKTIEDEGIEQVKSVKSFKIRGKQKRHKIN